MPGPDSRAVALEPVRLAEPFETAAAATLEPKA
jgi:hypothetical protein